LDSSTKTLTEDKQVYRVEGFSCANCAGKFEKNVKELSGVHDAKVNFGASKIDVFGSATVEDLERLVLSRILKWHQRRLEEGSNQW